MVEGLMFVEGPVEAQVLSIEGADRRWSGWAAAGTFVGSRGRGRPLIGLRLRMGGYPNRGAELAVDAMFLGSPIVQKQGAEVELVGPFGVDPLVGLRVRQVEAARPPATALRDTLASAEPPRLQLLRSRSSRPAR